MKPQFAKKIAGMLMPGPSELLEQVSQNAKVAAWIRKHRGQVPGFASREAIYRHIADTILKDEPIDFLEFGVREGGTMRSWLGLNAHPESRFYGFDTFTGLPEEWNYFGKGAFSAGGKVPDIADPRVEFIAGLFQDTLPGFLQTFTPRTRLVINNDSDLYSSTLYTLTMLHSRLVPGSIVIFDEFSSPLHEFRALHDYLGAYNRRATPIALNTDYAMQAAFVF